MGFLSFEASLLDAFDGHLVHILEHLVVRGKLTDGLSVFSLLLSWRTLDAVKSPVREISTFTEIAAVLFTSMRRKFVI